MAYELIAIDLDDTLLSSKRQISEKNRNAIKEAHKKGKHIVLASGRAHHGILPTHRELGLDSYMIACGGQVVDANENIVYAQYLPPLVTKQVIRFAAMRDMHFQVFLDDGYYYLKHNEHVSFYESILRYPGTEDPTLLERDNLLASKVLFIGTPEKLRDIQLEVRSHYPEVDTLFSMDIYLEVLNPASSKGDGLKYIAGRLGLEREQIIAIGDSELDISMLKYAGLGVAVANATPEAAGAADIMTVSNNEDAVAEIIEKYML